MTKSRKSLRRRRSLYLRYANTYGTLPLAALTLTALLRASDSDVYVLWTRNTYGTLSLGVNPKTLRLLSPIGRRYANPTLRSGRNNKSMSYGHALRLTPTPQALAALPTEPLPYGSAMVG